MTLSDWLYDQMMAVLDDQRRSPKFLVITDDVGTEVSPRSNVSVDGPWGTGPCWKIGTRISVFNADTGRMLSYQEASLREHDSGSLPSWTPRIAKDMT